MYAVLLLEVNCIFRKCFFCKKKVFDFFPKNSFHLKTLFWFFFEKIFKNSQNFFVKFLGKVRKFLYNLSKIFWHRQLLTKISAKFSRKFLPEISKNFRKFSKILPPFFLARKFPEISQNCQKREFSGNCMNFDKNELLPPKYFVKLVTFSCTQMYQIQCFVLKWLFQNLQFRPKKFRFFRSSAIWACKIGKNCMFFQKGTSPEKHENDEVVRKEKIAKNCKNVKNHKIWKNRKILRSLRQSGEKKFLKVWKLWKRNFRNFGDINK